MGRMAGLVRVVAIGVVVGGMALAAVSAGAAGSSRGPVSISSILSAGDFVTGVRGTTNGEVILTGSAATGNGTKTAPFLFRGRLTRAAEGAADRY